MRARAHHESACASPPAFSPARRSSHGGSSAGAVSPISPATPRSTDGYIPTLKSRTKRLDGPGQVPNVSNYQDYRVHAHHLDVTDYYRTSSESNYHQRKYGGVPAGPETHRPTFRRAPESDESESEHTSIPRPLRPW